MEYDVLIVGGGPAGLKTAALLAEGGLRAAVLERQSIGGELTRIEWIEDAAGSAREGGAALAARLLGRAETAGVQFIQCEVTELESYSGCVVALLGGGQSLAAPMLVLAGGRGKQPEKLPGMPDAANGLVDCALCDAVFYRDQPVAVCGGGHGGALDALHLARCASQVYLIEKEPQLTCEARLRELIAAQVNIRVMTGEWLASVEAQPRLRRIGVRNVATGRTQTLEVAGLSMQAGRLPRTNGLGGLPRLDGGGHVITDKALRTSLPRVLAIGDIRAGGGRSVAAALADAERAAAAMMAMLNTA